MATLPHLLVYILFDDIPATPASVTPAGNNGTIDATFIVKVINDDGGSLSANDFTINWFVSSGTGSINPASFKGQGPPGTRVIFQGTGTTKYDAKLNEEPGYTRIARWRLSSAWNLAFKIYMHCYL